MLRKRRFKEKWIWVVKKLDFYRVSHSTFIIFANSNEHRNIIVSIITFFGDNFSKFRKITIFMPYQCICAQNSVCVWIYVHILPRKQVAKTNCRVDLIWDTQKCTNFYKHGFAIILKEIHNFMYIYYKYIKDFLK